MLTREWRRDGDEDELETKGGKPNPGTPKDGRLKDNKPGGKKPDDGSDDDGGKKPFPGAAKPFGKKS